jgi:DNA-binding GntR family transcriptional regulator
VVDRVGRGESAGAFWLLRVGGQGRGRTADLPLFRDGDLCRSATREDILKEAGYEQVYDIDQIITRMPTPEEIERLAIAPGTPVAEHIRTGYTRTDQAVRVMISIVPGDTLILEYKIPT